SPKCNPLAIHILQISLYFVAGMSTVRGNFSMLNRYYAAFKFINNLFVVGRQKYGGAITINFFQYGNDIPGVFGVEVSGGLVCNQYFRLSDDSARDCYALTLTAG